jgi:hypothetical protein
MKIFANNSLLNGLISYWKLDGNLNDSIGNNNGINNESTYILGKINQGVELLSGQRINLNPISLLQNYSFSCWFKPLTYDGQAFKAIVATQNVTWGFYYDQVNNKLIHYDTTIYRFNDTPLIPNTWNHITFICKSGVGQWYLNGILDSVQYSGLLNGYIDMIGGIHPAFNSNENIDEVGFWNRSLGEAEILNLYNIGMGSQFPFKDSNKVLDYNGLINGAVSYWKLDGNSNDSINSRNGIDSNILYSSGKIGQAASFDGSISKISFPKITLNGNFTLCFWIKKPPENGNWGGVITDNSSVIGGIFFYNYSPYVGHIEFAGDITTASNDGFIPSDEWIFMSFTKVKNITTVYTNGIPSPSTGIINASDVSYETIGKSIIYNVAINAQIDELGIWERALSQNEINILYNNGIGKQFPFRR